MLPNNLQEAINLGYEQVQSTSNHSLLPKVRLSIYMTILKYPFGKKVLGWLAVISAKKSISSGNFSLNEISLEDLIDVSEDVLNGKIDKAAAQKEAQIAWEKQEELGADTDESKYRYFYTCQAAVQALYEAMGELNIEALLEESDEVTDGELDPWTSDTAKWAALSIAGAVWRNDFDVNKSRDFWDWWLLEAVSEAWKLAQLGLE